MNSATKIAYMGGGSRFVPSIVHGIADSMKNRDLYDVNICLYDINKERAEYMAQYCRLLSTSSTPIKIDVVNSQDEALEGAELVFASIGLWDDIRKVNQALDAVNAHLPETGPGTAAEAVAVAPFFVKLAGEIRKHCPEAIFATLVNPTDVLSLLMNRLGLNSTSICVEVEGLRGALAYYFRVPEDAVEMVYAGVNHDGWTLELGINGQDGYELLKEKRYEIPEDSDFHPGNYGMLAIFDLTGHLRSSAYHHPPFHFESGPSSQDWQRWGEKRRKGEEAMEEALRSGRPIADPPQIHPERSLLRYPGTGRTIGRMIRAIATGQPEIVPLQTLNDGAISNFPDDVCVEVPVSVAGKHITPQKVGELPEWLGGLTRLFAIQRRMIVDYLLEPSLESLKQAVSVVPVLGSAEKHVRFVKALHELYMRVSES